jgi:hypothetical protein
MEFTRLIGTNLRKHAVSYTITFKHRHSGINGIWQSDLLVAGKSLCIVSRQIIAFWTRRSKAETTGATDN